MMNRRVEYLSASFMVGWALILALPGNTIHPRHAYGPLIERGWTEVQLAVILGIVGSLWLGALWVNGHHRRSPIIRCLGAMSGVIMWSHIAFMLLAHSMETGIYSVDIATYCILAIFDLFSCARSASDAYRSHVHGQLLDRLVSPDDA